MKLLYSLLLVVVATLTSNAQNTLTGSVTSEADEPILATIYLSQMEKGTNTQLDGKYVLQNIPKGTYTIIYSALGYATKSLKITFNDRDTIVQDIILKESAVEMEEIIVSTPFHKLQSDNVMKVERITSEELIRSGAPNLSQGISNIAGVSTVSTGTGIGKPVIRGLSGNRVLTYTQGVRLENQQFGDEHGLGLNASGIESVEVIKGPASLLYGSDALGGILYFNPERFADADKMSADASGSYFSNTQGVNLDAGVKKSYEQFKWMLRGAYNSFADYETSEDELVTNSRYNEYNISSGFRYQRSKWKSTLRYNFNKAQLGIPEEIGEQSSSRTPLLPFQEIGTHILSWENNYYLNNSRLDLKAGYLVNDRREFEDSEEDASLHMKLRTLTYDLKYALPEWGAFETIAGVQGMFQNNTNFGEELLIPDAKKVDFGVFATSHYHLKKVDLQAGLRLDTRSIKTEAARDPSEFNYIEPLDRNFTSFTAALGAKLDLSDNLLGRINLASGFRAPNLAELSSNGVHEGTSRYEIGNGDLNNERNIQSDLSLEFRNEHIEIYANGFYNDIKDYIFISPTGMLIEEQEVFNYVQGDAYLYGGELGLHIHPHPLDWLHIESSFEMVLGELQDGGNLPLTPANTFLNTLRFEFNKGAILKESFAFITMQNTLDQNRVSQFETPTPGYNLLSLGAGTSVSISKVEFSIGVNITNLTNESYIPHLSRLKPDEIPNPGRSFNISLKMIK